MALHEADKILYIYTGMHILALKSSKTFQIHYHFLPIPSIDFAKLKAIYFSKKWLILLKFNFRTDLILLIRKALKPNR